MAQSQPRVFQSDILNMALLCTLLALTRVVTSTNIGTSVLLTAAVDEYGAVCLDGTPGNYDLQRATKPRLRWRMVLGRGRLLGARHQQLAGLNQGRRFDGEHEQDLLPHQRQRDEPAVLLLEQSIRSLLQRHAVWRRPGASRRECGPRLCWENVLPRSPNSGRRLRLAARRLPIGAVQSKNNIIHLLVVAYRNHSWNLQERFR